MRVAPGFAEAVYRLRPSARSGAGALRAQVLGVAAAGVAATAAAPNENHSRELLELFTLGPGNYIGTDVREEARAVGHTQRSTHWRRRRSWLRR